VAIITLHLDVDARAAQLRLQMNLMIKFDSAGIGLAVAERGELGVAGGEAVDARGDG
jgi:hypothetical protein